jgi:thiol-disulfide isomerase/thioredoxin
MLPATVLALFAFAAAPCEGQTTTGTIRVDLAYAAPAPGAPRPNFSPKGTQVTLTPADPSMALPPGATPPAKTGVVKVGPDSAAWIPVLLTASADHPADLTRLYVDRNRNHDFADDGPPRIGVPTQNVKTHAWWTSIDTVTLAVSWPGSGDAEPYLVNFWSVRSDSANAPDVIRYSVASWRFGTTTVHGVPALVAAMDADNNAVFDSTDMWSVFQADSAGAAKTVLSIDEARSTDRLMFLPNGSKEIVLQFRSFSPDGRSIVFAVVDKPVTKAADRAPDDLLRDERGRPRTTQPFIWAHGTPGLTAALASARASGKKVLLDFEATWCGPCHTMDQWIWTDSAVAAQLNAGYVGVKIDVDLEPGLVKRFRTKGYPTMIMLAPTASEIGRVEGYQSSAQMLAILGASD